MMWYINIEFLGFFKKSTLRVCLGDVAFIEARDLSEQWIQYSSENSESKISKTFLSYEKKFTVNKTGYTQKKKTFLYKTSSKKRFRVSLPAAKESVGLPPTAFHQRGEEGTLVGVINSFGK